MIIETSRLLLRPITEQDAEDIYEYSCTANVGPNAGWEPHHNIEQTRSIMKTIFLNQDGVYGIVLKQTGKLIGSLGLVDDPKRDNNRAKMLGYAIGEQYWGNGYMTEAATALVNYGFEKMGLELICAYCFPHNQRSRRVLTKLGFGYQGRLSRCERLYTGELCDNECYELTLCGQVEPTLSHIAIWTCDIERSREFYQRYFAGRCNQKYINRAKGFASYFISFGSSGAALELMQREDITTPNPLTTHIGLTHIAFTLGSAANVERLCEQLRTDGYPILSEPRTTGDGFYEASAADPDGNIIEIVRSCL